MPNPTSYISSVLRVLAQFLHDQPSLTDRDRESAQLLLLDVCEQAPVEFSWTTAATKSLITQNGLHQRYSARTTDLVLQFVHSYPPHQINIAVFDFLLALEIDGCSPSTIKNYRSDINQYVVFAQETRLTRLLTKPKVAAFLKAERQRGLKTTSILRKLVSITQLSIWAEQQGLVTHVSRELELIKKLLVHDDQVGEHIVAHEMKSEVIPNSRPTEIKTWTAQPGELLQPDQLQAAGRGRARSRQERRAQLKNKLSAFSERISAQLNRGPGGILPYINFVMVLLFFLGLGVFGYQQFVSNSQPTLAYPSSPTRPNRQLSFQGRLTDSAENPVTSATDMRFYLYDSGPSTSGGSLLWDSDVCSVTPDQDGIFSVSLGDACGDEIAANVFTENANVWLQVQIEAETLSPRQSIKSVAYALNSETLQGYPITATGAATVNTVVTMNSGGEVVLGENSPTIRSVQGTFSLEAQSLLLQTSSGSNGDITLDPDGTGKISLLSSLIELQGYLAAPGATLSATYAGGVPLTIKGGPSGTANLSEWQNAGGTPLTTLSSGGNLAVEGTISDLSDGTLQVNDDLQITGNDILSSTAATVLTLNTNDATFADALTITGDLTLSGADITGANSAALDIGEATSGDIEVTGDLLPAADATYDLGSTTKSWRNLYVTGNICFDDSDCASTWVGLGGGGGANYWRLTDGAFSPVNDTADLLIGSTASASAKFVFLNVNTGTPTASISGNSGNIAASLTGTGILGTSNRQTLTIGSSTTGNLSFASGGTTAMTILANGNVGIGTTGPGAKLVAQAAGSENIFLAKDSGGNTRATITNDGFIDLTNTDDPDVFNTVLKINNATVGGSEIGGGFGNGFLKQQTTGRSLLNLISNLSTNSLLSGGVESDNYRSFSMLGNGSWNVGPGTSDIDTTLSRLSTGGWQLQTTAASGITAAIAQYTNQTGDLLQVRSSGASTGDFLALNANGNVGIGSATPVGKMQVSGKAKGKALTILNETGDQRILSASAAGTTVLNLENTGDLAIEGDIMDLSGTALGINDDLQVKGNDILSSTAATVLTLNTNDATFADALTITGDLTLTGADITGANSAALDIGEATSGDIEVTGDLLPAADATYDLGSTTKSWRNLYVTGNICFDDSDCASTWVGLGGGGGANYWRLTDGAFSPVNDTADLLIGSTASASAKFAFLNVNEGVPSASVSANTTNVATYLSGDGTLGTTHRHTLSLGGSATGDILLAPGGATAVTLLSDGNIGIGTTEPDSKFHIQLGDSSGSGYADALIFENSDNAYLNLLGGSTGQRGVTFGDMDNTADGSILYNTNDVADGMEFRVNNNSSAMSISSGGNVGIGTTGPGSALDIVRNDALTTSMQHLTQSGAGDAGIQFTVGGSSHFSLGIDNSDDDKFKISKSTALGSNDFLTIDSNGNVGIGTTTPAALLDIHGGNVRIGARTDSSQATQTSWTKLSQSSAGTIASGGTASIASASASVVWNGSLYVGTSKADAAEVYRYDGGTTWTKVSQSTAGTIASSGTASIDMVASMTVYGGQLYIGTKELNSAEVYRYDGGTTWTKVSQSTAGTIRSSGTASIDGVTAMAVYQGRLFAGTQEGTKAELYRYDGGTTWTVINSTAGQFVSTNSVSVDRVSSMAVFNGTLFLGTAKAAAAADLLRYNGNTGASVFTKLNANTSGTFAINGSQVASYEDVTSLSTYNGALIIGLRKANAADVVLLDGNSMLTTLPSNFSRLNSSAGTILSGGTANINSVQSVVSYKGRLYIGTTEGNSAQVYRYEGNTGSANLWSQVGAAAGSFGSTASIDGAILQVYNDSLIALTEEASSAEVYQYTTAISESHQLIFNAEANLANGEQNSLTNDGRIFFSASPSASVNSTNGQTGAFIFSHAIKTDFGAYDLAEDYPTRDEQVKPGDVISLDPNERGMVNRSSSAYDKLLIGVYSTKPALRLSQTDGSINGGTAIPVALAGRVPVNVSTESGAINPGDMLTSSSQPGVAMKATKPGPILGKALEAYAGDGVGQIEVFMSIGIGSGEIIPPDQQLDAVSFENVDITPPSSDAQLPPLATQSGELISSGSAELSQPLPIGNGGLVVLAQNDEGRYTVTPVGRRPLTTVAALSEAVIGQLTAGLTRTRELIVDGTAKISQLRVNSLSIGTQTLESYITDVVAQIDARRAASQTHATAVGELLSPLADSTGSAELAQLTAPSATDSAHTQLTALLAPQLTTTIATVEGSLTADQLHAQSARIQQLETKIAQFEEIKAQTAELVDATISGTLYAANINDFEQKIASALQKPSLLATLMGSSRSDDQALLEHSLSELHQAASGSAALNLSIADLPISADDVVLNASATFIDQYLKVNGSAYVAQSMGIGTTLFVGQSLQVGDGLHIADGRIEYTNSAYQTGRPETQLLAIQPSGQGQLSLLAGLMTLSETGDVAITGNLTVAGKLEVQDTLLTNLLQPADLGSPFQVQVAGVSTQSGQRRESRFEIVNELGTPVATISAQGRALFAGGIGVSSTDQRSSTAEQTHIEANQTSGKATIAAGQQELTISTKLLGPESLVYITPISSTGNQVLYVKSQSAAQYAGDEHSSDQQARLEKTNAGSFVVGFDQPVEHPVSFNWWIVN